MAASNDKATAIGPVGNSRLPFKTSRVRTLPLQVEDIDDAISGACNFVVPVSILERIGHVEFARDPLPVEGCEPGGSCGSMNSLSFTNFLDEA